MCWVSYIISSHLRNELTPNRNLFCNLGFVIMPYLDFAKYTRTHTAVIAFEAIYTKPIKISVTLDAPL